MTKLEFRNDLTVILDGIGKMLLEKNESYGDSALNPKRIFSKADSVEQIKVRIDDKLSRIQNGASFENDNDLDDLLGYLVLLKIAMNRQRQETLVKEGVESESDMERWMEQESERLWIEKRAKESVESPNPMQMTFTPNPQYKSPELDVPD